MCLLIPFILKNVYLCWVLNIVTTYQTKCEINSVALLLGYNQVYFHAEALDFLHIYFPHILSISGKPHLFSWEILDSSNFVYTS